MCPSPTAPNSPSLISTCTLLQHAAHNPYEHTHPVSNLDAHRLYPPVARHAATVFTAPHPPPRHAHFSFAGVVSSSSATRPTQHVPHTAPWQHPPTSVSPDIHRKTFSSP